MGQVRPRDLLLSKILHGAVEITREALVPSRSLATPGLRNTWRNSGDVPRPLPFPVRSSSRTQQMNRPKTADREPILPQPALGPDGASHSCSSESKAPHDCSMAVSSAMLCWSYPLLLHELRVALITRQTKHRGVSPFRGNRFEHPYRPAAASTYSFTSNRFSIDPSSKSVMGACPSRRSWGSRSQSFSTFSFRNNAERVFRMRNRQAIRSFVSRPRRGACR